MATGLREYNTHMMLTYQEIINHNKVRVVLRTTKTQNITTPPT